MFFMYTHFICLFIYFCLVYTRNVVLAVGTKPTSCEANGNNYPLGRSFSFREECVHYDCDCKLDGSWECPSERARYVCAQYDEYRNISEYLVHNTIFFEITSKISDPRTAFIHYQ